MIIRHNIAALRTLNKVQKNNHEAAASLKKISSGLKIVNAADDSAGLAISEKMRAQIRGLEQVQRNAQDGISLIDVADGGLAIIANPNLQRMRELAVQAANDTLTESDRIEIQKEIDQIKQGINDIANETQFNGMNLLNRSVEQATTKEILLAEGNHATLTGRASLPSSVKVDAGVDDHFVFTINGEEHSITLDAGTYNRMAFIDEFNQKFAENNIKITASYASGTSKLTFTIAEGDYSIDKVSGNGVDGWLVSKSIANRTGSSFSGVPSLRPNVTIVEGLNDTLTFDIDSNTYSITIAPGTYNVYGSSELNENSPLLMEINSKLEDAGAPINARFIYYGNPDPPYNNGAGLYLTASESINGTNYLEDGDHTIGNFRGNAKSTLFDQYDSGWTLSDSSEIKSFIVQTYPAKIDGEKDLSNGITIESGINDTLNFDINGNPKSITLQSGSYDSTALLVELNNQFLSNSIDMHAYYNPLNKLVIEQTNRFDNDLIDNLGGSAMLDLFFDVTDGIAPTLEIETTPSKGILHIQNGANEGNFFNILLTDARTTALGIDDLIVHPRNKAEEAIQKIDEALKIILSERAKFGAYQNRLEHTLDNVTNSFENLGMAESRIRDVDIAKEYMKHSKKLILSQASQAMMAQANQQPQGILQLLR